MERRNSFPHSKEPSKPGQSIYSWGEREAEEEKHEALVLFGHQDEGQ